MMDKNHTLYSTNSVAHDTHIFKIGGLANLHYSGYVPNYVYTLQVFFCLYPLLDGWTEILTKVSFKWYISHNVGDILNPPLNYSTVSGSTAEFRCEIHCLNAKTFLWQKGDTAIDTSDPRFTETRTSGSRNGSYVSTLNFTACPQDDGVRVRCQIRLTDSNNITSIPGVLKVIGKLHIYYIKNALMDCMCFLFQNKILILD